MRFEVYCNQRKIVVWDTFLQKTVCSTEEVSKLQLMNCKIIAWMLNRNDEIF